MNSKYEIVGALAAGRSVSHAQAGLYDGVHLATNAKLVDKNGNAVSLAFTKPEDWRLDEPQEDEEVELLPVVNGRFTAPAPRGFRRSVAEAPTYPAWFRGFRFKGEGFETNVPCMWRFRSKDRDVEMLADRNDSKYYSGWNCLGLEWAEFVLWKREAK